MASFKFRAAMRAFSEGIGVGSSAMVVVGRYESAGRFRCALRVRIAIEGLLKRETELARGLCLFGGKGMDQEQWKACST